MGDCVFAYIPLSFIQSFCNSLHCILGRLHRSMLGQEFHKSGLEVCCCCCLRLLQTVITLLPAHSSRPTVPSSLCTSVPQSSTQMFPWTPTSHHTSGYTDVKNFCNQAVRLQSQTLDGALSSGERILIGLLVES